MTTKTEPQSLIEEIARLKNDAADFNCNISYWRNEINKAESHIARLLPMRDACLQDATAKEAELKRLLETQNDY